MTGSKRSRKRELERRASKLARHAPERRTEETDEGYGKRLEAWFQERTQKLADASELWSVFSKVMGLDERNSPLAQQARRLLLESPRPLPDEGPSAYVERAAAEVFGRAEREGGTELVREVQRLMGEDVREEERTKQELIARGQYPVAQVVRLPHGVTAKLTRRAAVLVEDNRVDLGGLLEDYAQRIASGRFGAPERAARGGYPIGGSTLVVAWIPNETSFYAWELGEIPGEEDQPVYREAEPEHPGGDDKAARSGGGGGATAGPPPPCARCPTCLDRAILRRCSCRGSRSTGSGSSASGVRSAGTPGFPIASWS